MRTVTFPLLAVLGLCGVNTARAADLDYDYLRGADYDPVPAPVSTGAACIWASTAVYRRVD